MSRTLGAILILASLGAASSASGGTNVRCAMNEDRVWVYESVVDFNLAAKLKCGEPVEIIGRVKGYVKVQTQSGVEGYVADSAFPKSALPPEPVEKPNDVSSASVAALAHHVAPASVDAPRVTPAATISAVSTNSSAAMVASTSAPPARVTPVPVVAPTPVPAPQPVVVASAPAPVPVPVTTTPASVSHAVVAVVAPVPPAPAPAPAAVSKPTVVAAPVPQPAVATMAAPPPAPTPVVVASLAPSPAAAPVEVTLATNADSSPSDRTTSEPEPVATMQPVSTPAPRPAVNPDDEEETSAVRALDNETAGCTHFFSAYGLSPNQYKWIAQNRKKAFPSVCPAPTPGMVDFVVIFTHDVGFYNVTMPQPVHVDNNGFSDWTPMSTVDTALMTQSEANSSHHEYVWVFHTTRGAFDPSKFSSRRKPLFSKAETNVLGSHGGYKTVMDALTFIEGGNATNR